MLYMIFQFGLEPVQIQWILIGFEPKLEKCFKNQITRIHFKNEIENLILFYTKVRQYSKKNLSLKQICLNVIQKCLKLKAPTINSTPVCLNIPSPHTLLYKYYNKDKFAISSAKTKFSKGELLKKGNTLTVLGTYIRRNHLVDKE